MNSSKIKKIKKRLNLFLFLVFPMTALIFILPGCSSSSSTTPQTTTGLRNTRTISSTALNEIQHVILIVLENTSFKNSNEQAYLHQLPAQGALLSNYFAVSHPSYPNYLALISGSTYGIIDSTDTVIDSNHIGDLLEAAGKNWRAYAESFPGNCFLGITSGPYAKRHVPFLSFKNVFTDTTRCGKVVSADNFQQDIQNKTIPEFSLYVPNLNNDGHDTGVAYADQWLSSFLGPLLSNSQLVKNTLFIITADEDDHSENNQVYTLFIGAGVQVGANSKTQYNHYSLLATIETIFGLTTLGKNDNSATLITDIWKN